MTASLGSQTLVVDYTKKKLAAAIALVAALRSEEPPHSHATSVLDTIERGIQERLDTLDKLRADNDLDVVKQLCSEAAYRLFLVYPLLGFLARSMDVRNAFELHGPLCTIVAKAVGPSAKLIISSEWEFSPFTYSMPESLGLSDVVFIGLPVSDSDNALAVPLSGHELGHNIWRLGRCFQSYKVQVSETIVKLIREEYWREFSELFPGVGKKEALTDLLNAEHWRLAWLWAMDQCEELFCDFVGLTLFGESYLHAFAYLIAPGLGGRAEGYPVLRDRVAALDQAARRLGVAVPDRYADIFEASQETLDCEPSRALLLKVADAATRQLQAALMDDVIARMQGIVAFDDHAKLRDSTADETLASFELGVPAVDPRSLAGVINAGWQFWLSGCEAWKERYPAVHANDTLRTAMLNELLFKSIEVLEINQIQGNR